MQSIYFSNPLNIDNYISVSVINDGDPMRMRQQDNRIGLRPEFSSLIDTREFALFRPRNDFLDSRFHVLRRNQLRAFELPRSPLVPGTPEEIMMIEANPNIVPTTIARVVIDDPVGRIEFCRGMRETADQHDGCFRGPGQPGQAAR